MHRRLFGDRARQGDVERSVALWPGVVEHVPEALRKGQVGVGRVDQLPGVPVGSQLVQPRRVFLDDGVQIHRRVKDVIEDEVPLARKALLIDPNR